MQISICLLQEEKITNSMYLSVNRAPHEIGLFLFFYDFRWFIQTSVYLYTEYIKNTFLL